jgi:hypothetical protein
MLRAAKSLYQNTKSMVNGCTELCRDDFITWDDIKNVKKTLDKETWRRDDDDAKSTVKWIQSNPKEVVLYQAPAAQPQFVPFSLVIQRDFQLEWLLRHGNGRCIAIDGTANTQKYKVNLCCSSL